MGTCKEGMGVMGTCKDGMGVMGTCKDVMAVMGVMEKSVWRLARFWNEDMGVTGAFARPWASGVIGTSTEAFIWSESWC